MNYLASGTVDCVYPKPVEADSLHSLADFESKLTNGDLETPPTHVSLSLNNKYRDGKYIPATFEKLNENDFSTCVGKINESVISFNNIQFHIMKPLSYDDIHSFSAPTVLDMILKLVSHNATGTLDVVYKTYPNGRKCYPETIKHFKILL